VTDRIAIIGIDHVLLVMPTGGEKAARRFYGELLGLREVPKPPELAPRGGCWFVGAGGTAVHLGVDQRFIAAKKAHPCLIVADLDAARRALTAADSRTAEDDSGVGLRRLYVEDPFGNRIELVDAADAGFTGRDEGPASD
jgi:catechol 2,3-dioxygenase-like lactoylglutathione lyase family enzyme